MAPNALSPPHPLAPIWTRTEIPESTFKTQDRKRGPKADTENHEKVVRIVRAFGETFPAPSSPSLVQHSIQTLDELLSNRWAAAQAVAKPL